MSTKENREGDCFVTGVHSEKLTPCVIYTAHIVSSDSYSYSSSAGTTTTTTTTTTTRYDNLQRHEVHVDLKTLQDRFQRDIREAKRVFWKSTGVAVFILGVIWFLISRSGPDDGMYACVMGFILLGLALLAGTGISKAAFGKTESGKANLTFNVFGENGFSIASLCGPKLVHERVKASGESNITWLSETTYNKLVDVNKQPRLV